MSVFPVLFFILPIFPYLSPSNLLARHLSHFDSSFHSLFCNQTSSSPYNPTNSSNVGGGGLQNDWSSVNIFFKSYKSFYFYFYLKLVF